ncbi:MAG: DUF3822 family protein [Bacteroidia bacterium]
MNAEKQSDAWISVIDESLNADVSRNMNLFLQCGSDFFAAAVLDTDRNKFVALIDYRFPYPMETRDLHENILGIIEQNKTLLDNRYDSVSLSLCGFKNTLLPDVFFDADKMETLFSINHAKEDNEMGALAPRTLLRRFNSCVASWHYCYGQQAQVRKLPCNHVS